MEHWCVTVNNDLEKQKIYFKIFCIFQKPGRLKEIRTFVPNFLRSWSLSRIPNADPGVKFQDSIATLFSR
jgi:hypothetical protein